MEHIQNSMIASKARRYEIRGKQLLTTLDKYYLMDLGLGNIVYNELHSRGYEVNGEIKIALYKLVKSCYHAKYIIFYRL